ncbi:MAG: alanine racemase [Chitinispirillaceae bacterium]|nr:alanine racemase [Chitinispirillaceae bacterium]
MNGSSYSPWLEISLDALLHNCALLRSRLPPATGILAVVKDRAYGCGSRYIAQTLEQHGGVSLFAVTSFAEAMFLRHTDIQSELLVLGNVGLSDASSCADNGILCTLNSLHDLQRWKKAGITIRFHCNIDTRMHRMGVLPEEVESAASLLAETPALCMEGAFTHLANAHDPASPTVAEQKRIFTDALGIFKRFGIIPRHIHYANSGGIINFSSENATLARPGIALYGCKPDPHVEIPLDLKPVVALKSRVCSIRNVAAGTPVSYGGTYVTGSPTSIATVALGYGSGLPRSLSNRGDLLIRGKRYRIAGTVTMDYCMVDAGPAPPFAIGEEAVAIGTQGDETITPDAVALLDSTIGYETLCRLSPSLPRTYLLNGRTFACEQGYIY